MDDEARIARLEQIINDLRGQAIIVQARQYDELKKATEDLLDRVEELEAWKREKEA